jgi:Bacterial mobilisation protein (MobC)
MDAAQFLKTRVSPATKARVQAVAQRQLLTESIWLRRTIDAALSTSDVTPPDVPDRVKESLRDRCLYVRLRPEDRLLLTDRAAARGMPAATYVSVLTRAHLRGLAPLPKAELLALRRTLSELGSVGRNLNQIARAANQGTLVAPGRDDLQAILRVCEALRDHVKGLLRDNVKSWEQGYAEPKP